jgi:hypothetical protein
VFAIPVSHQYCDIQVSTSLIYKFQLEISTNYCAKFSGIFEETNFGFLPMYCDQCNKLITPVEFIMCLAVVNCDGLTPTSKLTERYTSTNANLGDRGGTEQ